jgi:dienelactone hydrolase
MKKLQFFSLLPCLLIFALYSAAKQPVAPRVADVTAADGTNLKVSFFAAAKPGPGVLLLHQCNRQRRIWDGLALQLQAAGINVLTLDFRGFGQSGGKPFDQLTPQEAGETFNRTFPSDVDTALDYLKSQPGVNKDVIGVGGASCGVNQSIQAARRHPEVKSLVLLSGNTDLNGREFLRKPGSLPVFLAAADDDEFPPSVVAIEWIYSLDSNSGKRFMHYAIGGHGADMFPFNPELPGLIVDWYVTTLIKTPGQAPVAKSAVQIPEDIRMLDIIDQPGGPEKAAKMLADARQRDPKATLFREDLVNFQGYEHLQAGDIKGALAIMKLNATAFPDSPNVYDSLADAYVADGQKDLARQNAQKALDLLPTDTADPPARRDAIKQAVEQKLRQLGGEK